MKTQSNKQKLEQELKTICQELQEKMSIINETEHLGEGHPNTR